MNTRLATLLALSALLGPASCVDDSGPREFTTEGTCYPGDVLFCHECPGGERGLRPCDETGHFGECTCPGCTSFPDCNACGDQCFESCMCQTAQESSEACRETCDDIEVDLDGSTD